MAAVIKCEEAGDFYFAQVAVQAHTVERLTDNDLILLSKEKVHVTFVCSIIVAKLVSSYFEKQNSDIARTITYMLPVFALYG
jgi:hypothetical protein